MSLSTKYARTLHAPISLGTTSDDRFMPTGYLKAFVEMDLVLTEKLDGQNNCFNKHGVFARSHVSPSVHPWDQPLWQRYELIKHDLKEIELFGENMYGIHSIAYNKLESYFYLFAVRQGKQWLSWEEVRFYAALFDFPTVPEIPITHKLTEFYTPKADENEILRKWLTLNLGMDWEAYVNHTAGNLAGIDPITKEATCEGFVIRNTQGFATNGGVIETAANEFNNIMKLVRAKHVKTNVHWTKTWKPAQLINYEKYKWYGYEHLST